MSGKDLLNDATRQIAFNTLGGVPPMPEGFTDRAAWDAIHWKFSARGSVLDDAVIGWQRNNQERVKAATEAASEHLPGTSMAQPLAGSPDGPSDQEASQKRTGNGTVLT